MEDRASPSRCDRDIPRALIVIIQSYILELNVIVKVRAALGERGIEAALVPDIRRKYKYRAFLWKWPIPW